MHTKIKLIDLALPIFIEQLIMKIIGIINIYLFSNLNQNAVAAIGVSNQIMMFINMFFIFVTLGTTVIVSQNIGAGDMKHAGTVSSVAIMMNIAIGILLGALALLFNGRILSLLGLSGQAAEYASSYIAVVGGLCVVYGFNFSMASIMRNYGNAKRPMLIFFGMNALNLVGNTIIVFRPFGLGDFGIGGIAVWTVFSQAAGALAMFISARKMGIKLDFKEALPFDAAKKILRIGIPGAGEFFFYSVAHMMLLYFVTSLGIKSLVSYTYASNIIPFVTLLGGAIGQSNQMLTGRLMGAGLFQEAYSITFKRTWLAVALNLSVMALLFIFQRPVLSLFTSDAEIYRIVFWCFCVNLLQEFGRPFNMVIGLSVRAAGDVRWAIAASAFSILFVLIPLAYLLTAVIPLGVPGVFIALCADEHIRGQLMTWRWRTRRWENFVFAGTN